MKIIKFDPFNDYDKIVSFKRSHKKYHFINNNFKEFIFIY